MKKCLKTISKQRNDLYSVSNHFGFSDIIHYLEDTRTLNYISTVTTIKKLRIFKIVERNKKSKDPDKFVIYSDNNMPCYNIIYSLTNLQRHNFNLKEVSK